MKVLVGAFNHEKALVGAFSVIVKTDGSFEALLCLKSPVPWTHHGRETFDNLNFKTVPIWILAAQRAEIRPTIDDEEQTGGDQIMV